MVWVRVAVVVMCGVGVVTASFYPPECPPHCNCTKPSEAVCEGGAIPSLDPRITAFEIKHTPQPIPTLNTDITSTLQHLVSLQLDSIGLTEVEGGALSAMDRLHTLLINNNNITTLHAHTFIDCSTLTQLDLRSNNIKVIENGTFEPLVGLRNLSLANNALTSLPQHLPRGLLVLDIEHNLIASLNLLPDIHLHSLNLCHNLITHIDPSQINLMRLKVLCLGGAAFNLESSMGGIKSLWGVQQLTLQGTHSQPLHIPLDVQVAIQNFTRTSLHTLQLDSCSLESMDILNQANSSLRSLRATDTTVPMTRVRSAKMKLPSIAILDLSGSPLLAKLFLTPHHSTPMLHLKVLKISRCGIKSFQESFLLSRVPNITDLDLSHNPLQCTCYGMTWIPNYVREGRLNLLQELTTTCAAPPHLNNIPLLTASMCPIIATTSPPIPTTTTTTATNTPGLSFISFSPVTSTSATKEYSNTTITTTTTPGPSISTTTSTTREHSHATKQPLGSSFNKTEVTTGQAKAESGTSGLAVLLASGVLIFVVLVLVVVVVVLFCQHTRNYRRRGFSGAYNRSRASLDSDSVVIMDSSHDAGTTSSSSHGFGGAD